MVIFSAEMATLPSLSLHQIVLYIYIYIYIYVYVCGGAIIYAPINENRLRLITICIDRFVLIKFLIWFLSFKFFLGFGNIFFTPFSFFLSSFLSFFLPFFLSFFT